MRHIKSSAIFVLACLFAVALAWAVTACVNPDSTNQGDAWPSNATITVNISNFPANLQPCVKTAFDNWNAANGASGNATSVKFQPTFNNTQVATGSTGGTNVYQVTYEQTTNPDGTANNGIAGTTSDTSTSDGSALKNAKSQINPNVTDCTQITQVTAHEIGHTEGLGDCSQCTQPQQSVMVGIPCKQASGGICIFPDWNNTTNGLPAPTTCDNNTVNNVYYPPPPPPPPPPQDCNDCSTGCCVSPVIIDTSGKGFFLTDATNGVMFDIFNTGKPIKMAWTTPGASNGFLALPGPDGIIHSSKQLFGNFTPQPPSGNLNGFAALAVYDQPANGGNDDGIIDANDEIFSHLRLWIDSNHDGISQPNELYTLPSLGVNSISLTYKWDGRTDQYGNVLRYRAPVNAGGATDTGRMAYDVYFRVQSDPNSAKAPKCVSPGVIPKLPSEKVSGR